MAEKQRILIVDDDYNIAELISLYLTKECFETKIVGDGEEALRVFPEFQPNLILLDLMLPGIDGYQVCRELRSTSQVPIIMLSAKGEIFDKVLGLELGADDYITKPFSTTVLCAKVKACLRRMGLSSRQRESILSLGPFRYVCDEMRLFREGTEIPLSSKESLLIKYFFSNPNRILSKEQIYRNVWGNDVVDDNTIMVHIRHLRVKIEADATRPNYLRTIRGVGYQFVI